jgi:hypothetical protein
MGEGNFGGDGSVRWRIHTRQDKKADNQDPVHGPNGKNYGGSDDDHGSYFIVKLRRPNNTRVEEFWTQLVNGGITIEGDYVVMKLTIEAQEKTKKQIIVNWSRPEDKPAAKARGTGTK